MNSFATPGIKGGVLLLFARWIPLLIRSVK
jgi:hypothetical protein